MSQMVYIRELHPHSFLHFSPVGEGFRLRDFSRSGKVKGRVLFRQSNDRTASTIREMASRDGNFHIEVNGEGNSIKNYAFWHQLTLRLNREHQIPPPERPTGIISWIGGHITTIVVGVITAVLIAVISAWLGLKQ